MGQPAGVGSESGDKIHPQYQSEVLGRNRSPVYASLEWLKEMHAIDDGDLSTLDHIKACRNTLAHKLFSMLGSEGLPADFEECLSDMVALLRKIEAWWITNVEIPTNPDFEGKELDEEGIVLGSVMSMQLLMDIALGDAERSRFYYDELRKPHRRWLTTACRGRRWAPLLMMLSVRRTLLTV